MNEENALDTLYEIHMEDLRAVGISAYGDEGFTTRILKTENYESESDDTDEVQYNGLNDNRES